MSRLGDLRTLLNMAPEKAAAEDRTRRFPQLHLPPWHRREKDAPIRVLLLGGPLDRRICRVDDATDPDIHITAPPPKDQSLWLRKVGSELGVSLAHLEPITYWYRMRRVPLEGFSLFRPAFYVGVVGEVEASFAPDLIVP